MPVYEYRCPTCSSIFEKLVSMSESMNKADCPTCRTPAMKLLSTFASVGSREAGASSPVSVGSGGCCGGGCCGGGR